MDRLDPLIDALKPLRINVQEDGGTAFHRTLVIVYGLLRLRRR